MQELAAFPPKNAVYQGRAGEAMNGQRPDVTDEEVGMRAFNTRKARAVERASERMRLGLGHEWDMLSQPEIELLGWTIGELWAFEGREDWEAMHFSKLTGHEVRELMHLGKELRNHTRPSVELLDAIAAIVRSRS